MGKVARCLLLSASFCFAQKRFYPDDPLWREPPPKSVQNVAPVELDNLVDFYKNSFQKKGERNTLDHVVPSVGTNTLDELPDSAWYTNRHARQSLSLAALAQGPNVTGPPEPSGVWTITSAKSQGVTPGFSISDSRGRRYLLKFDPPDYPELATAADVVGAKFFYALGYNVPENYIVTLRRESLQIKPGVQFTDRFNNTRVFLPRDLDELLKPLHHNSDGSLRAMASLYVEGKPLGGFKYYKRRPDDPNELAPHEHLRVLRGLYVFAAWLNHTDSKSLNSLDTLVEEDGRSFVKHYLIDFGASLGSDSIDAKDPRLGHDFFIDGPSGRRQLATLGLAIPDYARVDYPDQRAVGNFSAQAFHPERWKGNYPNAAFRNRLWGDEFWGAAKVMAFRDQDIRAIVHEGRYSDPSAEQVLGDVLIARRDLIGKTFFARMAALADFHVEGGQLRFTDLAAKYSLRPASAHQIRWARFDNDQNRSTPAPDRGPAVPGNLGPYVAATISGDPSNKTVTVYLRQDAGTWTVVGIDREGANIWEAPE